MSTPLKTIFISEFILVFAMAMGVAPQEFSYLILVLLIVSFIRLNMLDSLKLFIISIPLFVALPANALSDSMSIWRVLIIVLFLKVGYEKYKEVRSASLNEGDICECCILGYNELKKSNYYKLFLLIILFFIIAAISLISAQDVGAGVKKILFLLNIFLLFPVVIFNVKNKNDFKEIIKFIFYSTGLLVFIGYLQFILTFFISLFSFWQFWAQNIITALYGQNLSNLLSYSNTWFSYYEILPATLRMFSLMPDSHSFAMLVIISIPAVLSMISYYMGKEKKYLSLALIFFLLAVFFSGSRGA